MAAPSYRVRARWLVPFAVDEVFGLLSDWLELPRWWPAVYLAADEIERGEPDGVGRVVGFVTKGWAPFTLHWQARVERVRSPFELRYVCTGDLEGSGHWTLTPQGDATEVVYEGEITAEKGSDGVFAAVWQPLRAANHRWALAQGGKSLQLELARRAEGDPDARARIAAPPGATPTSSMPFLVGSVGAVALATGAALLRRRPRA